MTDFDVVWPRAPRTAGVEKLAPRPPTLAGLKVAFLWDYLFRGEEIFPILEDELAKAFPGVSFIPYDEFGTTHGEGEHELVASLGKRLRDLGAGAVVSGMGC